MASPIREKRPRTPRLSTGEVRGETTQVVDRSNETDELGTQRIERPAPAPTETLPPPPILAPPPADPPAPARAEPPPPARALHEETRLAKARVEVRVMAIRSVFIPCLSCKICSGPPKRPVIGFHPSQTGVFGGGSNLDVRSGAERKQGISQGSSRKVHDSRSNRSKSSWATVSSLPSMHCAMLFTPSCVTDGKTRSVFSISLGGLGSALMQTLRRKLNCPKRILVPYHGRVVQREASPRGSRGLVTCRRGESQGCFI